jgi:CDGSH-type Zn-finger protein/uncharacterized Fe-S cluster protein YjdI
MSEQRPLRRYEGAFATITWDARRCIHAAECVHALPSVFDPAARPWIDPGDVAARELSATVQRCPTGALRIESATAHEPQPAVNTAQVTADGPIYLRGNLALIGADGSVAASETRMAACRCGASGNKPYCDGSHRKTDFHDAGVLAAGDSATAGAAAGGVLSIRLNLDGPMVCTGTLTLSGTNGTSATSETTFLCRCGGSRNKPYCDGSHKRNGFKASR